MSTGNSHEKLEEVLGRVIGMRARTKVSWNEVISRLDQSGRVELQS